MNHLNQDELCQVTQKIAAELSRLIPPAMAVKADRDRLLLTTATGADWFLLGQNIEIRVAEGMSVKEALRNAVLSVLNEIQDVITVHLRTPWPQDARTSNLDFAEPHAVVSNNILQFWFGAEEDVKGAIKIEIGKLA